MKYIILLGLAFSFIGLEGERIFRTLTDNSIKWKDKLKSFKLLLMMPVYGLACIMIELVFRIPIMKDIEHLLLLMLCGMIIGNVFELGFGILYNKVLKLDVWCYEKKTPFKMFGKKRRMDILNQIDIFHSLLWAVLTIPVVYFSSIIAGLVK